MAKLTPGLLILLTEDNYTVEVLEVDEKNKVFTARSHIDSEGYEIHPLTTQFKLSKKSGLPRLGKPPISRFGSKEAKQLIANRKKQTEKVENVLANELSKFATKKDQAIYLAKKYPDLSRQDLIQMFEQHLEMTKSGAMAYYYQIKNELGL